jgi:hypothetical protein
MRGLVRTLYTLARLLNDLSHIRKGTVGKRIRNRVLGRLIGKRIFR